MGKNSFSLLETIVSIFLLSIIIIGFSRYSYYDNFDEEFMKLNSIENAFTSKNYNKNFLTSQVSIQIIKNKKDIEIKNVKKLNYNDKKIKVFKYEL
ncbi:MAG: hypothetical protein ACNI25_10920 [Halarcobacter sp.]